MSMNCEKCHSNVMHIFLFKNVTEIEVTFKNNTFNLKTNSESQEFKEYLLVSTLKQLKQNNNSIHF